MTEQEQYETFLTYAAILASDMATSEAFEFITALRKSPLCRHQVKQWCQRARDIIRRHNQRLMQCFNSKEQFAIADINDAFETHIKPDIIKLRYAIRLALQHGKVRDYELVSLSASTSLLSSLADETILGIDNIVRGKLHRSYSLRWLSPSDLFLCIKQIGGRILNDDTGEFSGELHENIRRGLKAISNKLMNYEFVASVVNEGMEESGFKTE